MAALDLETGKLLWKTLMTPADYPGNAVWGSSPAIDTKRGSVYVATGNNNDAPPEALVCVDAATTSSRVPRNDCSAPMVQVAAAAAHCE